MSLTTLLFVALLALSAAVDGRHAPQVAMTALNEWMHACTNGQHTLVRLEDHLAEAAASSLTLALFGMREDEAQQLTASVAATVGGGDSCRIVFSMKDVAASAASQTEASARLLHQLRSCPHSVVALAGADQLSRDELPALSLFLSAMNAQRPMHLHAGERAAANGAVFLILFESPLSDNWRAQLEALWADSSAAFTPSALIGRVAQAAQLDSREELLGSACSRFISHSISGDRSSGSSNAGSSGGSSGSSGGSSGFSLPPSVWGCMLIVAGLAMLVLGTSKNNAKVKRREERKMQERREKERKEQAEKMKKEKGGEQVRKRK